MESELQELQDIVARLETSWNDHDCLDGHDCKADEEEAHAAGYDEGRVEVLRDLLDDVETWQRQEAVGLVTGTMILDDIKKWLRRKI